MVKKIIYCIIYSALLALMLAAEVWLAVSVIRLNMLPDLYLWILLGALTVLFASCALLLFVHKKGKWIGVFRQIVACVLMAVTVAGCVFVTPKVAQLYSTVEQITVNEPEGPTRSVYVQKDDPAMTIADATEYTFAALLTDEQCVKQVVEAIKAETGKTIQVEYFDDESLMAASYYSGETKAMILNKEFLDIWAENELYFEFDQKNRVLNSYAVVMMLQEVGLKTEPDPEPVADITNTPFVAYISGMDSYSQILGRTRSDVNILMVVNPVSKQILMVNTPRDYYIVHPWGSGGRDKLTHCGVYGIECSVDALENLYGVPVNYYMQINFAGFEQLIDAIGGITIHLDTSASGGDATDTEFVFVPAGDVTLGGREALVVARDRKTQPGGDNGRGLNQMKVVKAVIEKIASARTIVANYSQILKSLEGMIATNLSSEDLSKLVKMQLSDMAQWNVQTYAVTGYGGTQTTYSMPGLATYVMHPHQSTVNYGSELIQKVIDGEILTAEDMKMS